MKKVVLLLTLITIIGLWPFLKKGYFESHDGEWMVIRFSAFHQTLVSGQFPVRFVDRLNNNYGYPVLNFLYPLPFYFSEIPKILGFGFVDSIKVIFILSTIASVLAVYWALSQLFDKMASLTGAILYLYVPYRFVDLYVRGSLGENLAFAFVPIIAGCLFKIEKGEKIFLPVLSLSIALLILSHNVVALLFLPFFLLFSLVFFKKRSPTIIAFFILGILISTFFWLPALYDLQFVRLSQIKVSNVEHHLVSPFSLIAPSWGYGPTPTGPNALSVQFGIVAIALFISTLYLRIKSRANGIAVVDFLLIVFALIAFMMTKFSLVVWQSIPFVDVIQFPWRLLSLSIFITAYLAAFVINTSAKKLLLMWLLITAGITSTITYTKPSAFVDRGDGYYTTNEDSTTVRDEYLPLWVEEKPKQRAKEKIEIITGNAKILSTHTKFSSYMAQVYAPDQSKLQVNTIYFPGWRVKIDGREASIDYKNKFGLMTFELPPGEHAVIIRYAKTSVHLISELVTVAALVVTGGYFYFLWRKQNF